MKFVFLAFLASSLPCAAQTPQVTQAEEQFPEVDAIVNDAVQTNLIPGAVVFIGHDGTRDL